MNNSKTFLVLDTETVGLEGHVYDMGWAICNKRGEIVHTRNHLVLENFTNPKRMMGAFYAGKTFTHYAPMLQAGTITMQPWAEICALLAQDFLAYDVDVVAAYNAGFDLRVIRQTHDDLGNVGRVLPRACDVLDIWQFACETKLSQKQYRNIALSQGWVSGKGNIKTGAEFAFRFCSGDWGFIEDHTSLSDVMIEVAIMAECFRQKKSVPYNVVNNAPWRIVNRDFRGTDNNIHGSKVA